MYMGSRQSPSACGPRCRYHGGMNEHQLAISETTFGGLHALSGQDGLIDYGTLMDLALQRCTTAREAILFMDAILKE